MAARTAGKSKTARSDAESGFHGFSKETLKILREIRAHNSKPWFEAHRGDYEHCLLEPMYALVADLAGVMLRIDPELDIRPYRVASRIRRDTRFSHDKSLYKKSMWLTFKRPIENWQDSPAYYFEIFPDGYRYGMGFYAISRETLANIRGKIEERPDMVREVLQEALKVKGMELAGEEYKRIAADNVPADLLPLYRKKELFFVTNRPIDATLFSAALVKELAAAFVKLASLYHFLHEVRSRGQGIAKKSDPWDER